MADLSAFSQDNEEDRGLVSRALDLASGQEWFDDSFLLSMEEIVEAGGNLTHNQREAVERIYKMLEERF